MTPRIPLSLAAIQGGANWFPFLYLKSSDIVLIPLFGVMGFLLFGSVVYTFLTTFTIAPTLPTLFDSSLTFYRFFRNYLEVISSVEKTMNAIIV
ncbi:MAG: hypothetical protein HC920_07970 [Oscillatoriales cyanobacterium SM2_3_0]|nr:hypothetical protein [Oscillatoriales cyanobacterium SM2_3_0]